MSNYPYNYHLSSLVGKKVLNVEINDAKDFIAFHTDKGIFSYLAYGDCCSSSWFEHISGLDVLIGSTVEKDEEIEMGEIPQKKISNSILLKKEFYVLSSPMYWC